MAGYTEWIHQESFANDVFFFLFFVFFKRNDVCLHYWQCMDLARALLYETARAKTCDQDSEMFIPGIHGYPAGFLIYPSLAPMQALMHKMSRARSYLRVVNSLA